MLQPHDVSCHVGVGTTVCACSSKVVLTRGGSEVCRFYLTSVHLAVNRARKSNVELASRHGSRNACVSDVALVLGGKVVGLSLS